MHGPMIMGWLGIENRPRKYPIKYSYVKSKSESKNEYCIREFPPSAFPLAPEVRKPRRVRHRGLQPEGSQNKSSEERNHDFLTHVFLPNLNHRITLSALASTLGRIAYRFWIFDFGF